MRLQWALDNLRFLMERVSPRHWGEAGETFETESVRCAHVLSRQFVVDGTTGQFKRNKNGEMIEHIRRCKLMTAPGFEVCHLHGGPSGVKTPGRGTRIPDPMRLVDLAADINREIDALPPRPRRLFHLLYRAQLPLKRKQLLRDWIKDGHHERYVDDVKRQLGYGDPAVFRAEHDTWVWDIEWKLIHHFPEARHAS